MKNPQNFLIFVSFLVFFASAEDLFEETAGRSGKWEEMLIVDMENENVVEEVDATFTIARSMAERQLGEDPLYLKAWHLHPLTENARGTISCSLSGSPSYDFISGSLDIEEAWKRGYTGQGHFFCLIF
jgi:hypothetical protein